MVADVQCRPGVKRLTLIFLLSSLSSDDPYLPMTPIFLFAFRMNF